MPIDQQIHFKKWLFQYRKKMTSAASKVDKRDLKEKAKVKIKDTDMIPLDPKLANIDFSNAKPVSEVPALLKLQTKGSIVTK